MTGRRLALELRKQQLGGLAGRNDIFELNATTKARFGGVTPGTREAEYLALHTRVWFDLNAGTWESRASASRVIHRDVVAGMLERITRTARAVTDAIELR